MSPTERAALVERVRERIAKTQHAIATGYVAPGHENSRTILHDFIDDDAALCAEVEALGKDAERWRAVAMRYVSADFRHEVEYINGDRRVEPVVQLRIPDGVRVTAALEDYADALIAIDAAARSPQEEGR